jgi:hypothetical protein
VQLVTELSAGLSHEQSRKAWAALEAEMVALRGASCGIGSTAGYEAAGSLEVLVKVLEQHSLQIKGWESALLAWRAAWLDAAFSVRDAGATTQGAGYIGFRVEQNIPAGTKWFVWGTKLVLADEATPLAKLQFLGVMAPGALSAANGGDVSPNLGAQFLAVHGDWHPGNIHFDGERVSGVLPHRLADRRARHGRAATPARRPRSAGRSSARSRRGTA